MNRAPIKAHQEIHPYFSVPLSITAPAPQKAQGDRTSCSASWGSVIPGCNSEHSSHSSAQPQEALWDMPRGWRQPRGTRAGAEQELTPHSTAGDTGTEAEAETRAGGQGSKGRDPKPHSHHSPAGLKVILVTGHWDCASLPRASRRACAIILRTDRECKPNRFFSSLSKSDDQLWL